MAFLVPTTAVCTACKATSPAELTIEPAGSSGTLHGLGANYGDSVVPTQHGEVGGMVATGWRFPSGERVDPPPRPMEAGLQAELVPTHAVLQVERRWHWVNLIGKSVLVCSVACAQALRDQERAVSAAHEVVTRKSTDEHVFGPLLPEIERLRGLADAALPPSPPGDVVINLETDIENGSSGWRYNGYWRGWAQTTDNIAERDLTTFGGNDNAVNVHGRPSAWSAIASLIRRWDTAGRPPAHLRRIPLPEGIDRIVLALKGIALRTVGSRRGKQLEDDGIAPPGADGTSFLYMIAGRDSWAEIVDLIFPDASVTLREEVAFRVDTAYRNEATFGTAAPAVMELRARIAGGGVTPEQLVASVVWLVRLDVQSRCYKAFCRAACEAVAPEHTWSPTPLDRWHDFLRPNERTRWRFAGICPDAPYALTLAAAAGFVASMELLVFGTAHEAVEHARRAVVEHGTLSPENLELLVAAFWRGEDLAINEVPACLLLEERRFSRLAVLLLPDAATDLRAQVAHALADGLTDHDEELRLFGDAGGVLGSVEHLRQSVAEGQLTPEQVVQSLLQMAELVKRIYGGVQASQFPAAFELLATARLLEFVAVVLPEAPASFQVKVQTLLAAAPKPVSPPDDPEKE